ncbi:cardiolipin synthase [Halomonas hibernica]|uniref:cardiolipin synthase n=1 Tax=Halomonas hibernica TaxID=2591147 RepID=UPI0015518E6D|nr:cardiolipin synthase [Halomonas hibernica]
MSDFSLWFAAHMLAYVALVIRVLTVEGKEPASRAAWILILSFLPGLGIIAYLLLGEPWISRRSRRKAIGTVTRLVKAYNIGKTSALEHVPDRFRPAFRACEHLAHSGVTNHNTAMLTADSNAAIDAMVEDFDAAKESIHISFYIWLTDNNGLKIVEAVKRAAERGVTCRIIVDGIGSRALTRSEHWAAMKAAGVQLCVSLKVSFGLDALLGNRADLRNHRKIVVVDNRLTYCGSQNCADPEFRVKAKYAPWVDIMLRFEGPVVMQNQLLFAANWLIESNEHLDVAWEVPPSCTETSTEAMNSASAAIAFGTGPLSPKGAMSDVFSSLLHCAQHEVVISNPYFVPDASLLSALIGCARRGVQTTLILPQRNDSFVVGAISKAYYAQLVAAGVKIFEFRGGLLHAKTLVVDEAVALVGSANMDRRSLELNFENNILLHSPDVAKSIRERQNAWLSDANEVVPDQVIHRSLLRRIGDNVATIFSPVM